MKKIIAMSLLLSVMLVGCTTETVSVDEGSYSEEIAENVEQITEGTTLDREENFLNMTYFVSSEWIETGQTDYITGINTTIALSMNAYTSEDNSEALYLTYTDFVNFDINETITDKEEKLSEVEIIESCLTNLTDEGVLDGYKYYIIVSDLEYTSGVSITIWTVYLVRTDEMYYFDFMGDEPTFNSFFDSVKMG